MGRHVFGLKWPYSRPEYNQICHSKLARTALNICSLYQNRFGDFFHITFHNIFAK